METVEYLMVGKETDTQSIINKTFVESRVYRLEVDRRALLIMRRALYIATHIVEDITKSLLLLLAICEDEYLETNLSILSEGLAKHLEILMKQRLW